MSDPLCLHQAYKRIFDSSDGQAVLEDIKRRGFYRTPLFSTESGRTQFNEGRRSMLLHVLYMMDPDNFEQPHGVEARLES